MSLLDDEEDEDNVELEDDEETSDEVDDELEDETSDDELEEEELVSELETELETELELPNDEDDCELSLSQETLTDNRLAHNASHKTCFFIPRYSKPNYDSN